MFVSLVWQLVVWGSSGYGCFVVWGGWIWLISVCGGFAYVLGGGCWWVVWRVFGRECLWAVGFADCGCFDVYPSCVLLGFWGCYLGGFLYWYCVFVRMLVVVWVVCSWVFIVD